MEIRFDQSQDFDVGLTNSQEIEVTTETAQPIEVIFYGGADFDCGLDSGEAFEVDFGKKSDASDYDGAYTVTPTTQTQTLQTANKTLAHNVVINPIPSNYGLITWNGSTLTVS